MNELETQTADALDQLHGELGALFRTAHALIERGLGPGDTYLLSVAARTLTVGTSRVLGTMVDPEVWENEKPPKGEDQRVKLAQVLGLPILDPMITQWLAAHNAFNKGCHWEGAAVADVLVAHFRALSAILVSRLGPFFDVQDDLARLAKLNDPSSEDAERLRPLLLLPVQREHFFEIVEAPKWLEHLEDMGAFDRIPRNPPTERWSELARWASWPEGLYLGRIAASRPDDVLRILLGKPANSDSPLVWRRIVTAAHSLPDEHAAAVAEVVKKRAGAFSIISLGNLAIDLATRLLRAKRSEGLNLLTALLTLSCANSVEQSAESVLAAWRPEREPYFDRLAPGLLEELVKKAIPAAMDYDPLTLARRLRPILRRAMELAAPEGASVASSKGWCRGFDDKERRDSVRAVLLKAYARSLIRSAQNGNVAQVEQILAELSVEPFDAFTRVIWYVLAHVGELLPSRLSHSLSDDRLLDTLWGGREAALLLRNQLAKATATDQLVVLHAFERGPTPDELHGRLERHATGQPTSEDVVREIEAWQRNMLRWFRGAVPAILAPMAARLGVLDVTPSREEYQLAEDHSYASYGGWVVPHVPMASAGWDGWGSGARVRFLRDWRPSQSDDFLDERRGVFQQLESWSAANSREATKFVEEHCSQIPQGAARAIVSGIRQAFENGASASMGFLEPVTVLFLCEPEVAWSAESWFFDPAEGLRDLLRLVTAAADAQLILDSDMVRVADVIGRISQSPTVHSQTDVVLSKRGFERAQTNSWNSLGGELVQAVVSLGLCSYRLQDRAFESESPRAYTHESLIRDWLLPAVDRVLVVDGICGLAASHRIGQYLPQLRLLCPEWVAAFIVPRFATGISDPDQDPIWAAYLVWSNLYDDIYREWSEWYSQAASTMPVVVAGETSLHKPFEHLLLHLTTAHLRGLTDICSDDGIATAYRRATADLLSRLYWTLWRGMADSSEPPPAPMLARYEQLWTWRVSELATTASTDERATEAEALLWFVISRHVPPSSALALGLQVLPWVNNDRSMLSQTWERIDAFIVEDASAALALVTELLRAHARSPYPHLPEEASNACAVLRGVVSDSEWRAFVSILADLARNGWPEVRSALPPRSS
ncbi:MAG: hypothetical protein IT353_08960 [Gemmatimonadaceae bacterium]|nr:hypothetical protein [Gemmatimonadaceae bacterium]